MCLRMSLKIFSISACALSALMLGGCGAVIAEGLTAATIGGVFSKKDGAASALVKDAVSDGDSGGIRGAAADAVMGKVQEAPAGWLGTDAAGGDLTAAVTDGTALAGTEDAAPSPDNVTATPGAGGEGAVKNTAEGTEALSAPVIRAVLDLHNSERRSLGEADLSWDADLANAASEYAGKLAAACSFVSSGRDDLGENVFTGAEGYYSAADGVRMWLGEKANYDPAVNGSRGGKTFGHYAQMVRPQAQKIGCAIASGCGNMFLVCSYRPGGSTAGAQPR